jgi:hypothetical protein
MSQATNTHPAYDVSAYTSRAGVIVLAAASVAAVMVTTHGKNYGSAWNPGFTEILSLFSWAHWILVALVFAAGVTLVLATKPTVAAVAAVVGLGPAAQLFGVGIVAARHWHPAAGMQGPGVWANQGMIVIIAFAGALAATVAVLTFLRVLGTGRHLLPASSDISTVGRACVVIGVLVAGALPLLLAIGDPFAHDATSLGAFALLWSLPWGGVLVLTAWLERPAAIAAALTVAVSAASAYPNYELVQVEHNGVAVLTGLVSGLLVAALRCRATGPEQDGTARASLGEQSPQ